MNIGLCRLPPPLTGPPIYLRNLFHICFVFAIMVLSGHHLRAQEMFGLVNGNYAGTHGISLNPSSMHNYKTFLDINLLSLGFHLDNNYLYYSKKELGLFDLFKRGFKIPEHEMDYGTATRTLYTYSSISDKDFFSSIRIDGPSAMIVIKENAFALNTAFRTNIAANNVPYHLANFVYLGLNYRPQHNINYIDKSPVRFGTMSWGEIGISYARTFYKFNRDVISAGISIKKLLGISGMYIKGDYLNYMVLNDSTIDIRRVRTEIGTALPLDYSASTADFNPLVKGGGWGFDLGITYRRLKKGYQTQYIHRLCEQRYEDYLYRVGFSLIDIGYIRFKHNAEKHVYRDVSNYWEDVNEYEFTTLRNLFDTLSIRFYGDRNASLKDRKFTMFLPSAVSVQFDYHYKKYLYFNATFIYGFYLAKSALSRPPLLAITPRFEDRHLEVSLPLSLYNWRYPHIGLSIRYYWLTIGTEKLGALFRFSHLEGLDAYIAIKFKLDKGDCGRKGKVKNCESYDPYLY